MKVVSSSRGCVSAKSLFVASILLIGSCLVQYRGFKTSLRWRDYSLGGSHTPVATRGDVSPSGVKRRDLGGKLPKLAHIPRKKSDSLPSEHSVFFKSPSKSARSQGPATSPKKLVLVKSNWQRLLRNTSPAKHRGGDFFSDAVAKRGIFAYGKTGGGMGNQILTILENFGTIRKYRFGYAVPPLYSRFAFHPAVPASQAWDLEHLNRGLKGSPPLHESLPAACNISLGGRWDIVFVVFERGQRPVDLLDVDALHYVVPETLSQDGPVKVLVKPNRIDALGNLHHFVHKTLRRRKKALQELDIKKRRGAICLLFGPHLIPPRVDDGKLLIPSKRHRDIAAKNWPLKRLAVIHLRYEEVNKEGCRTGPPKGLDPNRVVCVARSFPFRPESKVMWIPQDEYARRMALYLQTEGVDTVYLTRPPYISETCWKNIGAALVSKGLNLAKSAAEIETDGDQLNLIERALAYGCKVFIAEGGSTWSSTVDASRSESWKKTMLSCDLFDAKGIERRKHRPKGY